MPVKDIVEDLNDRYGLKESIFLMYQVSPSGFIDSINPKENPNMTKIS